MTKSIGDISARILAELATGVSQSGKTLGKYYVCESLHVTPRTACDMLRDTRAASIHVPNAGAGSYREFFTSLGFTEVQALQQFSSAGDWSFAVQDRPAGMWYPATQTNRYPRHGFEYTVDFNLGFSSVDELCRHHEL